MSSSELALESSSRKYLWLLAIIAAYGFAYFLIYLIHINYVPINVIFYAALLDAVLALILVFGCLYVFKNHTPLSSFEISIIGLACLIAGYAGAISGPTVLDRSLSFYILEKIDQRGGGVQADALNEIFVEEYIPEYQLMEVRRVEQVESGTVEIVDGCMKLTAKGRRIVGISKFLRRNMLAKKRLLNGEYSDALIDPLAGTNDKPVSYKCS